MDQYRIITHYVETLKPNDPRRKDLIHTAKELKSQLLYEKLSSCSSKLINEYEIIDMLAKSNIQYIEVTYNKLPISKHDYGCIKEFILKTDRITRTIPNSPLYKKLKYRLDLISPQANNIYTHRRSHLTTQLLLIILPKVLINVIKSYL